MTLRRDRDFRPNVLALESRQTPSAIGPTLLDTGVLPVGPADKGSVVGVDTENPQGDVFVGGIPL